MKKQVALILALTVFLTVGVSAETKKNVAVKNTTKVEVYYFHFTRRCVTCNAVETESKKALEAMYPNSMKSGVITFMAVNLDEEAGKAIGSKLGVGGQSLLIVGKDKKTDLVQQGFQYARNSPNKLKAELKKVVDPLLK